MNTERMTRRPAAVRDARIAARTGAQVIACSYDLDLSPEDAEAFLHSEYYAHLAFLRDRDALTDPMEEIWERREHRRARADERAKPFGRTRHLLARRSLERPPYHLPF
jgi:hypothetical protein